MAAISPTSERSIAHSCTDSAITRAPGSIDRLPVTKEAKLSGCQEEGVTEIIPRDASCVESCFS